MAILSSMSVFSSDREKATYVGGGRYVGEGKSVDDAVIRGRSDEYSERQQDRQRESEHAVRSERRDRDYEDRSDREESY